MPRDLGTPEPVTLTESPSNVSEGSNRPGDFEDEYQREFVIIPQDQQYKGPANLHPYTRPLTISDLESVVALENAAFTNPRDRATREKLAYRLSKCGELSLGIFCTALPNSKLQAETLATGKPVETSREDGAVSVLLGHVVAAKILDPIVTDDSMACPSDWEKDHSIVSKLGHQEGGRTIAVHSVAVLPHFQGHGLGRILMMAYMQQMNGAGIADRLALIAHDHKIQWYEKLGFTDKGNSKAQFGGGGWYDLVYELKTMEPRAMYG